LTTRRVSHAEVEEFERNAKCEAFALRLSDILGDHGIISVIVCEMVNSTMELVLWVMSCRVIGRQVERAALGFLVEVARKTGCKTLRGKYIPTARNRLVETHYANLGFAKEGEGPQGATVWVLPITAAEIVPAPLEVIDHTSDVQAAAIQPEGP
jgi:FkbH-like protein